jgi:hypothetical protein
MVLRLNTMCLQLVRIMPVAILGGVSLGQVNSTQPKSGPAPPPVITINPVQAPAKPQLTAVPSQGVTVVTYPASTPERFAQAIGTPTGPKTWTFFPFSPELCSKKAKSIKVYVHANGGASGTRLGKSGDYCFILDQVNRILYDYTFTGVVPAVQETPLDLLKDAISTITGLLSSTGAGAAPGGQAAKPTPTPAGSTCPVSFVDTNASANTFSNAIAGIDPGKDSAGKVIGSVAYATTRARLDTNVTPSFRALDASIAALIAAMGTDPGRANCADAFAQAESVIGAYVEGRDHYLELLARASASQVAEYEQTLQNYSPFVLTATQNAKGAATDTPPQVFNFDPLYSLVTSSAGFMVTELPARTYTSGTAPNPASPTTGTQSVLVVNFASGVRPTLDALLNVNIPGFNAQNYGVGLSIGPVYDISSGKADTSNLGLFGGISFRVTDYLYLTPGFHLGQFADYPEGFTHAGQVIPPNTGTPTPIKRYTARFGFSITFKLKDLYSPKANANSSSAPPAAGKTKNTGNQGP